MNTGALTPVEASEAGEPVDVNAATFARLNSLVPPKPESVVLSTAVVVAEIDLPARFRLPGSVIVAYWLSPLERVAAPR